MKSFDDRCAVVTGGGSGIGNSLCRELAQRGARVAVVDVDAAAADEVARELVNAGHLAVAFEADVADALAVETLAGDIAARLGPVHVLCPNAGVLRPGAADGQSVDDWTAIFSVNVFGVANCIRSFVPAMKRHGDDSHVMITSSTGGLFAAPWMAAYVSSKFAVVGLAECLALELEGTAVGVSVLCPGPTRTPIYTTEARRRASSGAAADPAVESQFARLAALDRPDQISPDRVASAAVRAILRNQFYVLPDDAHREPIEARLRSIETQIRTGAAL